MELEVMDSQEPEADVIVGPLQMGQKGLMDLPREVRVEIYKSLGIEEVLNLRTVSKEIKKEIDNHIDFHVRIDTTYKGFRRLTNLRILSCTFVKLTQKLPTRNRNEIFMNPHLLTTLVFDGPVSIPNLNAVLKQCLQVEHLVFTHQTLGIEKLFPNPAILQNLENLTHLDLQLHRNPNHVPILPHDEPNMFRLLDSTFPKLTSFKLYYSVWGYWITLLQFLHRHATTLVELSLQVGDKSDSGRTSVIRSIYQPPIRTIITSEELEELKKMRLRVFQFRDDVLDMNPAACNIFLEILNQQTKLEVLHFNSPGQITRRGVENVIRRNGTTLEEIVIHNLKNDIVGPNLLPFHYPGDEFEAPIQIAMMDMGLFSGCKNLRTISLSCLPNNRRETLRPIRLTNIATLPPNLERFHTYGFTLLRSQLVDLIRKSPNLVELLIEDAGPMRYSEIITNGLKLCPQLEYISIRPIIIRRSSNSNFNEARLAEAYKMTRLYNRFMGPHFDPVNDLDGFEARLTGSDRDWIHQRMDEELGLPNPLPPGFQFMIPV